MRGWETFCLVGLACRAFHTSHIPQCVDRMSCMWERRATHGEGRTMHATESDVHERVDHLGSVAGACQDIGLGAR
jgi:hypothetical protein